MKNWQLTAFIVSMLTIQLFASCILVISASAQTNPSVYVGIDVAYGAVSEAKSTIDKVSGYTNLIVFGSTQVTWFPDRVNETFQYAYDKSLSIISLPPSLPDSSYGSDSSINKTEWYKWAQSAYGNKLVGFYCFDEPGGNQLDGADALIGQGMNQTYMPNSYAQAASMYTSILSEKLTYDRIPDNYKQFTSDYGLYWFDYKAGYDVVFTEIGGNYSQQVNIALCRGAATAQNKDWGAIITWKYNQAPFIESPQELYDDMLLAYNNGAKYIVVFDSDEQGHSILTQDHLDAIQRFYNYAQNNPATTTPTNQRTAYVLPNAYGFGFRWPTDHIWGIWQADELSANITTSIGTLLNQYGDKLDIIYDDNLQSNNRYNQLVFWDTYDPTPTSSPTPTPTATIPQTLTPSDPPPNTSFNAILVIVVAVVVSAAVAGVLLIVFLKKKH